MKIQRDFSLSGFFAFWIIAICCGGLPHPARAGGVVTGNTDAELRAALAGGGTVTFASDGTIALTNTLTIASDTMIDGTGHNVTISGGGAVRIAVVNSGVHFTLKRVTLADGYSDGGLGGALFNGGLATIADCTFSNNVVANGPVFGGAIYNDGSGTLAVTGSTFVRNWADVYGGAIAAGFPFGGTGTMGITNCTFVANGNYWAVAIMDPVNGAVTVENCTFAGNTNGAVCDFLNQQYPDSPPLRMVNCIVASPAGGTNVRGIWDAGHNLSTDGSLTNTTSIINADPLLGPLADNGGPTWTMALGAGSPALDQADAASAPATDQRGVSRPVGNAPDIGAFEGTGSESPEIHFLLAQYSAGENIGLAAIQIERTGSSAGAASVDFSAVPGTATSQDFAPTNQTVTFAAGDVVRTVYVTVINDTLVESNETVLLSLINAAGAVLTSPDTATLTILDDDQPGYLSSCDEAGLRAAISNQVWVVFSCDTTLELSNTITISGDTIVDAGGHAVTLSGHNAIRLFDVLPGANLTLKGLTLAQGLAAGNSGVAGSDGAAGSGGAIRVNQGALTLADCKIWTNTAAGGAGANGDPNGSGGAAFGGAVYVNQGTLTATNTEFAGNLAAGGAGGVTRNSGANGSGGAAFGGAVYAVDSTLNLENCRMVGNQALGGLAPYSPFYGDAGISGDAAGGALFAAGATTATVRQCEFVQNHSAAIAPDSAWLGASGGTVWGGAIANVIGNMNLSGCELALNSAAGGNARRHLGTAGPGRGGALHNGGTMTLAGCIFAVNYAQAGMDGDYGQDGQGGAVYNVGSVSLADTLFTRNYAVPGRSYHGGLYLGPDGLGQGGAVYNGSNCVAQGSTFAGNWVTGAPGGFSTPGAYPGSPAFGAAIFNVGSFALTNSTIASNSVCGGNFPSDFPPPFDDPSTAGGGALGGGVYNTNGNLTLINCTLADNVAVGGGGFPAGTGWGGGLVGTNATTQLRGTIIANSLSGSNGFGSLTDLGYNLSSDASCNFSATGSLNNTDPVLGPLGDYGGPTPTLPLLAGSPAIDAGDPANYPATDQRGHARPYGSAPDIGAFESSPPFVISGRIIGATLRDEVSVEADTNSVSTINGRYRLAVTANTYTVTPTSPDYLFLPANQMVTVGPDLVGVNFKAYHWNALSLEGVTNGMLDVIFPGTNGATYWIQNSSNLVDWTSVMTNTVGLDNFLELQIPITSDPGWFYRTVKP